MSEEIIYLAGPYSKGNTAVRLARFHMMTEIAARLIEKKLLIFSPITMTHPIDVVLNMDGETLGSDFWTKYDEAFMRFCRRIFVITAPGWSESSGVKREIDSFRARGIQPEFFEPSIWIDPADPQFRDAFL